MPIRIKLFLIIIFVSLVPLTFLFLMVPQLSKTLLTSQGATFLVIFFITVLLVTFISFFTAIQFSLPLIELRELALRVQKGDLSQRSYIKTKDELGDLSLAFNTMLDALQNQHSSLQNSITQATILLDKKVKTLKDTQKATLNILEDLEEGKAKDEAILLGIGDGVIVTDQEGKILLVNKGFTTILGWEGKEVEGKLLSDIVLLFDETNKPVPGSERLIYKTLSQKTVSSSSSSSSSYEAKNKTLVPVSITVSPILVGNKLIGAIEIFRDVTKEREVDKAKSEFVSLASHQLRTPLGIVKWYLEALGDNNYFKKSPLEVRKYFDEISKSNERVLSLVRDLLSVSRIDQGRVKDIPKSISIPVVVKEVVEETQILAHKKEITLNLVVQNQETPLVKIDILRFHEVIENLITNAIEYTKPHGSVDVLVKAQSDMFLISVTDTGIGMSIKDQKSLFTKFFRAESASASNPEGSGLGLYVVKSYIEGWGGKITVQSIEGKGSTFSIALPIKNKDI